jgi:signal transduction histidine kinase
MSRGPLSRRIGLTTGLVAINAGLVLFAVACLVGVATVVLRDLGDQQALARLELAGAAAIDQVGRTEDELATSARLLAASSLAAAPAGAIMRDDLDRFRGAGDLDGCALQSNGHAFARSSGELPWPAIEQMVGAHAPGDAPSIALLAEPELFLVASAPVEGAGTIRAVAIKRLDQALVRSLSEVPPPQPGMAQRDDLRVTVLPATPLPAARPEESALRATAIATGHAAARLGPLETYRDVRVLRAAEGPPVALVETSLPTAAVDGSLDVLARRLLLFAALIMLLSIALSAALGRLLARPLGSLAMAAERIGAGDFNMPIPGAASIELGSLATTMDRMRQHLRRLTAELERREAEAQALLGGIVEGVFAVDGDRRIRYLNPQAAQLLQIDPTAALGRFCGDVLDPQGEDGVRPCAESCPIVHARSRGASRSTERLRRRDGSRLTTVITSAPPADGRQVQVLRDETDVEAARRLRDAILANVSHEFKTPLSAQLASIELLRDSLESGDELGPHDSAAAAQLVQSLERGTLRLQQLVDNLLESVRIEAGAPGLRSAPVSIEAVVDGAAELTGPLLAQRAQRLVVDLPAALPELHGDPPRLTQVLVNLLANANKFAPPGSEIRVGAEHRDGEVMLWVEDAGPGLPPGAGGTIFERFVRAPQEPLASGMGLGLWIVKSIVEAHGGRVEARNLPRGGTRFSVILPAGTDRAALREIEEGRA